MWLPAIHRSPVEQEKGAIVMIDHFAGPELYPRTSAAHC
jgi:hypothetical protein